MVRNLDSRLVSYYKNISLALVFLMYPCLLVEDALACLGVNVIAGQLIIFANLTLVFLFSLHWTRLSKLQKYILIFYSIIILYLITISILLYTNDNIIYLFRHYIKQILFGVMFVVIINHKKFNLIRLNKFIINISFLLAFMSIILFVGYILGLINLTFDTFDSGTVIERGLIRGSFLGYLGCAIKAEIYSILPRSQSFWTEPSRFAQFLILPFSLSMYRCLKKKNVYYMLIFCTIATALLLTFSVAVWGGMLIAFIIYRIMKKHRFRNRTDLFNKKVRNMIILLLVSFTFFIYYQYTFKVGKTRSTVISKAGYSSLNVKLRGMFLGFEYVSKKPFGDVSFFRTYKGRKPGLAVLLHIGGIPLFSLFILFLAKFYLVVLKRMKKSEYGIVFAGCVAYIISFIWFGNFFNYYYLFHIALFSKYLKYNKAEKQFSRII